MTTATQAMGPDSRLLLVDGHSLAYRAFYALPVENFMSPDGQPTNAIHGFVSMLLQVVEAENPTHIAVAFDVNRDTFRRAEFPDYKANRAKSPVEFAPQVPVIREVLESFGIVNLAVEGFEADDIIATLTTAAATQQAHVSILTGDRDSMQLVSDNVTVLYPTKGVRELARMTPEAVLEKFGVRPDQYADLAALRGDASDNLPSIPGVGDKTAASWLSTYGDLNGLIAAADEIRGKVGENLRAHVAQVLLNRRLTQLVHDVPLNATVDDLHRHLGQREQINAIFDKLGFKQLRQRAINAFVGAAAASKAETVALPARTFNPVGWQPGNVSAILSSIDVLAPVGVAVAAPRLGEISAIAIAWGESVVHISLTDALPEDVTSLRVFLADPQRRCIVHSGKSLEHWMLAHGHSALGVVADTELLLYLLMPGIRGLDLESCVERVLHRELPQPQQSQGLFGGESSNLDARAVATLEIFDALSDQIPSVKQLHDLLELPTMRLLARMELVGIAIDDEWLNTLLQTFEADMHQAERRAHELAGRAFNLGSPKQLQEVLFDERGLPRTKKNKTGYTTDAEALQWLFDATKDPVVTEILRWREVSKLKQTVAGLLPLADAHKRIHTTFAQTVAATGRLSSVDPNLQNIPVRTAEGRKIRAGFIAGVDYECLLTADYSQIEMRIMAHLSDDEGLIAAFNSGEDLHTTVGSLVFNVAPADVTPDMRRRIKAMSYGLAYGLSAYGLSQQLGISPSEATSLMETYFERFGGVQRYLKTVVANATRDGFTETMFGRRRYLPDLTSTVAQARAAAERMALNAPIQGSAADLMKRAMLGVQEGLEREQLRSRLLLQVHDELVLEVWPGEKATVEHVVREAMAQAADLKVPLDVSVGFGPNWDAAAH